MSLSGPRQIPSEFLADPNGVSIGSRQGSGESQASQSGISTELG
jgi:hypothetical protein